MQDGNPTGKFCKRRSYLGVFVGFSNAHAGSVPLVFNPKTKLVSPQYHCVFDEGFDTAVSTCDKKDLQEKIFQYLTFLGNESDHWEYIDEYEKNSSRQLFDNTWNLEAMVEDMKEKKDTL